MNLARIKFFGLIINGLCKVQTVCFEKLASGFDSSIKVESSEYIRITAVPLEHRKGKEKETYYKLFAG